VPTKRALDAGDSAAFSSIFLASGFFCSRSESRPAHLRVTQTVRQPRAKPNTSLIRKFRFWQKYLFSAWRFSIHKVSLFLAVALFKVKFLVNIF
jgi:hypothetical protein